MPFQVEVSGRKALESMKGKVLILMLTAVIWECALSRFIHHHQAWVTAVPSPAIPEASRRVEDRVMERHGEHVALPQLPGSVVAAVAEANRQAARHRSGSSSSVDGMGYIWSARWAVGTAREWAIPLMG